MDVFFDFDQQKQAGDEHTFISANTFHDSLPSNSLVGNIRGQIYFIDMLLANHFKFAQQGNSKGNQMF